jgi:hypothetical protein
MCVGFYKQNPRVVFHAVTASSVTRSGKISPLWRIFLSPGAFVSEKYHPIYSGAIFTKVGQYSPKYVTTTYIFSKAPFWAIFGQNFGRHFGRYNDKILGDILGDIWTKFWATFWAIFGQNWRFFD